MARTNDDIIQKSAAGCVTVVLVFGFLFAFAAVPAAVIGHLLGNFTPSVWRIFAGSLQGDPNWQAHYPHMILRFAAIDAVLVVVATFAVRRLRRRRGRPRRA